MTLLGSVVEVNPESIGNNFKFDEIEYIDISSVGTGILTGTRRINLLDAPSRAKRVIRNGDTLLATVRPNLRSFYYAQNVSRNYVASTGFAILRAGKEINNRFLYYIVTNQAFTDFLAKNAKGSAYPAVDIDTIKRAVIFLPPLPTQRKIASILSAYDDLIENNLRRINILEEMAQNLYREWFVKFRFPGWQNTRFVDSPLGKIPEGWEVGIINDILTLKSGFGFKSHTFENSGRYGLVTIKNVQDSNFLTKCATRIGEIPANMPDYCVLSRGDILLSLTGNIGRVCLVYGTDYLLNQRVAKLVPVHNRDRAFVYFTFMQQIFKDKLYQIANGVAQQNLSPIDTGSLRIVIPPLKIRSQYYEICEPIIELILNLLDKNLLLTQTRNLLLPKLISGEIDVSELDINVNAAEVN